MVLAGIITPEMFNPPVRPKLAWTGDFYFFIFFILMKNTVLGVRYIQGFDKSGPKVHGGTLKIT